MATKSHILCCLIRTCSPLLSLTPPLSSISFSHTPSHVPSPICIPFPYAFFRTLYSFFFSLPPLPSSTFFFFLLVASLPVSFCPSLCLFLCRFFSSVPLSEPLRVKLDKVHVDTYTDQRKKHVCNDFTTLGTRRRCECCATRFYHCVSHLGALSHDMYYLT